MKGSQPPCSKLLHLADDYALARMSSQKCNSSKTMLPPVSHVCSQETLPTGLGRDQPPNNSGKVIVEGVKLSGEVKN